MKPKVLVLMATYNGEKYLREQLDSILNQHDVDVYIKIADDKSIDNTVEIIKEYERKYKNISHYINKENKGFTYNFIDLIFSNNAEFNYYALSDQDDVWKDNKLISAIKLIQNNSNKNGCLYCSNLDVVDSNLKFIEKQEDGSALRIKRYSYLVNNIATGCTIVFNSKFYKHILKHYPQNIYLHDYWLCLVAKYSADFIYDLNSYILYRQHGNLIGTNKKIFTSKKINETIKFPNRTSNLIKEFYILYTDDIYLDDRKYIKLCANYRNSFKNKIKLLISNKIKKRKCNIIFKAKVLFNKY